MSMEDALDTILGRVEISDADDAAARAHWERVDREQRIRDMEIPQKEAEWLRTGKDEAGRDAVEHPAAGSLLKALSGRVRHLICSGEAGTGKSCAAALAALQSGLAAMWMPVIMLGQYAPWDTSWRKPVEGAQLLVVDDLGQEQTSRVEVVEEIITIRHHAMRRTIYTTNLGPKDIEARYSQRIQSRWRESGKWIPFKQQLRNPK